jgi:GT2 family glycosyltransferase
MPTKPLISVLLSFQNRRDEAESSLNALFKLQKIPFELIIIDDASSDDTGPFVKYFLDSHQRDDVNYIKHTQPAGRGNCLNQALQRASSSIVWAPQSIHSIDEKSLQQAVTTLQKGSAPCLIQTSILPASLSDWPALITKGKLPQNGKMLWNLDLILTKNHFINPFLKQYHGVEWLIRLGMDSLEVKRNFYKPITSSAGQEPSPSDKRELFYALMRRPGAGANEYKNLAKRLAQIQINHEKEDSSENDFELLEKAVKLKMKGQLSASLEYVEKMLERRPGNPEAQHLKIKLLENKRRYVEAAELKHKIQHAAKSEYVHPELNTNGIKTSIIIPTALYGKPALENCLLSVDKHCAPAQTELIIIDNASLDDTHEYLRELQQKNFYNCRVITNQQNRGFAASVNQGLELAEGKYACIMHNDVELQSPIVEQLEKRMDHQPNFALMAPLADNTLNPEQSVSGKKHDREAPVETDRLDSFFIMIRTKCGIRMDEAYELAFFDDIDFCYEAKDQGYKVGIVPDAQIIHHYGTTTFGMDLDTNSRQYWKNINYFNDKWDIQRYSEAELQNKTGLEQLLLLDEWVNPLYPEPAIQTKFEKLFTEELKTEILTTSHNLKTKLRLIRLMMVMGKRDIMRSLEEKIEDDEDTELPAEFLYEIVRFYFSHNVYSRCLHYLNRLTSNQESIKSQLYRLAILIGEKKMAEAVPLLSSLLNKIPSNPMLYKLAGDMHAFAGNTEEATSFYDLAAQINPFAFGRKQAHSNG